MTEAPLTEPKYAGTTRFSRHGREGISLSFTVRYVDTAANVAVGDRIQLTADGRMIHYSAIAEDSERCRL